MIDENNTNIICLETARFKLRGCEHLHIDIDEKQAYVKCRKCGENLNPIWVLLRLAREESRFQRRREAMIEEQKKLDGRVRTKCVHCGQITKIKT